MKQNNCICLKCKKPFHRKSSEIRKGRGKYCSRKCKGFGFDTSKEKNVKWKGGIKIHGYGYILVASPDHPFKDKQGYVREHRLVMEEYLGRYLEKNELIHHKDGNKKNNRIENLEVTNRSEHKKLHPEIGMNTRFIKGQRYNL